MRCARCTTGWTTRNMYVATVYAYGTDLARMTRENCHVSGFKKRMNKKKRNCSKEYRFQWQIMTSFVTYVFVCRPFPRSQCMLMCSRGHDFITSRHFINKHLLQCVASVQSTSLLLLVVKCTAKFRTKVSVNNYHKYTANGVVIIVQICRLSDHCVLVLIRSHMATFQSG